MTMPVARLGTAAPLDSDNGSASRVVSSDPSNHTVAHTAYQKLKNGSPGQWPFGIFFSKSDRSRCPRERTQMYVAQ